MRPRTIRELQRQQPCTPLRVSGARLTQTDAHRPKPVRPERKSSIVRPGHVWLVLQVQGPARHETACKARDPLAPHGEKAGEPVWKVKRPRDPLCLDFDDHLPKGLSPWAKPRPGRTQSDVSIRPAQPPEAFRRARYVADGGQISGFQRLPASRSVPQGEDRRHRGPGPTAVWAPLRLGWQLAGAGSVIDLHPSIVFGSLSRMFSCFSSRLTYVSSFLFGMLTLLAPSTFVAVTREIPTKTSNDPSHDRSPAR